MFQWRIYLVNIILPQQHCAHDAFYLQWQEVHLITSWQMHEPLQHLQHLAIPQPNHLNRWSCWPGNQGSRARSANENKCNQLEVILSHCSIHNNVCDRSCENYLTIYMIHRNIKISHGLPRVKITCKHTVCTCFCNQVCNKFCSNWFTPLSLRNN